MYKYLLALLSTTCLLNSIYAQTGNDWCKIDSCPENYHIDCTRGDGVSLINRNLQKIIEYIFM